MALISHLFSLLLLLLNLTVLHASSSSPATAVVDGDSPAASVLAAATKISSGHENRHHHDDDDDDDEDYRVPAIFVFGDSLVDVGNNNGITSYGVLRADHPVNGIDFLDGQPTGRFSNGKNIADYIARKMGYRLSPLAYSRLLSRNATAKFLHRRRPRGINFGSGGSGIFDTTGVATSFKQQIENFQAARAILAAELGEVTVRDLLSKSLFLISAGSDDIFDFIHSTDHPSEAQIYGFYGALLDTFKCHLKTLHSLGARAFAIIDVPPVGCTPMARTWSTYGVCSDFANRLAREFNAGLEVLLNELTAELTGFKHSIGSAFAAFSDMVDRPHHYEFNEVRNACCGDGNLNAGSECNQSSNLCSGRKRHIFWDRRHLTQAAAKKAAKMFYDDCSPFVKPINFRGLVNYDSATDSSSAVVSA